MKIVTLGSSGFLSGEVVRSALRRGHQVVAVSRGHGAPAPTGAVEVHADRDDPDALARVLSGSAPDAVVDVCGYTVAGAQAAAGILGDVGAYAYVSSVSAYRAWPPGPVRGEGDPLFTPQDDLTSYGPMKAESERVLGRVLGDRLWTVRPGLIIGPGDTTRRMTSWLHRIATREQVAVPGTLDQPMAFVDVRDLAELLVTGVEQGWSGPVTATGPVGMTTFGGLLEACREAVASTGGTPGTLVPIAEDRLLAAGVEPWRDLPFWLPHEVARTAWDVDTTLARSLGLAVRPVQDSVTDTWRWVQQRGLDHPELDPRLEPSALSAAAR
ncbi:NAD-dependent epimerase/dehydratase family protein [Actinotalea sp. K2]|uniref:NAD-dependent epimerase/dehydratase family protein n=1 Tax=Actinotalea sp. K2 TaxID=2939438 RepID=UPI002017C4B5|nr:NAD-dependent epimerase/dehydratase family protein [Actinotalea sp. K2]MCL3859520.1 NAD-dependent epimerase/dehydratase family protein [Actinotalea sp. K2]